MNGENKNIGRKRKSVSSKTDKKKLTKVSHPKKVKLNPEDGIAKSKQLATKQRTSNCSSGRKSHTSKKNNEVRLCGNGKPMPTLAELEKMYEDSDTEEETNVQPKQSSKLLTPVQTPESPIVTEKLTSPKTIEKIANKLLDIVSNLTEPILLHDDVPPPPVIKPKKRKKPEKPYIVGCKNRPYVPSKPNASVFKGDNKYGIDQNNSEKDDDEDSKKRSKRTKGLNFSKSLFNAATDEIVARLKENDGGNSDASSDSDRTVAYEYYTPIASKVRSFSPLPSTSKDNETFVKNDQLFNESLISYNSSATFADNDIEIIETPCETIVINDSIQADKPKKIDSQLVIDVLEDSSAETPNQNQNLDTSYTRNDDDCVQIVDVKPPSPIPVDDYYSSCTLDTSSYDNDVCEVIDLDDLLAENDAIIKKYSQKGGIDTVTSVDINNSIISEAAVQIIEDNNSISNIGSSVNNSSNIEIVPVTNSKETCNNQSNNNTKQNDCTVSENDIQQLQNIRNLPQNTRQLLKDAFSNLQRLNQQPQAMPRSTVPNPSSPACQLIQEVPIHRSLQSQQATTSLSTNSPERGSRSIGDCPICMDSLSNKNVASTMCGHLFCMNCIKLAIKTNGRKCPTCRKTLKGAGFHQIFL